METIKNCTICGVELGYRNTSGMCQEHHDFYRKRSIGKKCITCGDLLLDINKTGYCKKHVPLDGENNPMYGKSVYDGWVKKYGIEKANALKELQAEKLSDAFKKKWKDDEYRNLIRETTTGLKRSDDFKLTQSLNAMRQMNDPKQLELRSISMSNSYVTGKLNANENGKDLEGTDAGIYEGHFYASSNELERIKFLIESGYNWKRYDVTDFDFRIHYVHEGKQHLYLPDFVIYMHNKVIIEEFKSRDKLVPIERAKADAARRILVPLGIKYVVNNNPSLSYKTKSNVNVNTQN